MDTFYIKVLTANLSNVTSNYLQQQPTVFQITTYSANILRETNHHLGPKDELVKPKPKPLCVWVACLATSYCLSMSQNIVSCFSVSLLPEGADGLALENLAPAKKGKWIGTQMSNGWGGCTTVTRKWNGKVWTSEGGFFCALNYVNGLCLHLLFPTFPGKIVFGICRQNIILLNIITIHQLKCMLTKGNTAILMRSILDDFFTMKVTRYATTFSHFSHSYRQRNGHSVPLLGIPIIPGPKECTKIEWKKHYSSDHKLSNKTLVPIFLDISMISLEGKK